MQLAFTIENWMNTTLNENSQLEFNTCLLKNSRKRFNEKINLINCLLATLLDQATLLPYLSYSFYLSAVCKSKATGSQKIALLP